MGKVIHFYYYLITIITFRFFDKCGALTSENEMFAQSIIPSSSSYNVTDKRQISEYQLAEFLFQNYSSDCRPRRDATQRISVSLGITLYALNEIVERTHNIIITASLIVRWWDEFLRWDHTPPYSDIELFVSPSRKIWLPDIALTNSGDLYAFTLSRGMMVVLHSNGTVEYFPEATVKAFCQFDLTYFPFDHQMCEFRFESWSYIISQQIFYLFIPPVNTDRYIANEQWDMIDMTADTYTACYNITRSRSLCYPGRKSGYYVIMIIIPSIIFSAVELVAFSLPLVEVSKLQITFTCLLSYTVFQTTVQSDLPRTSEHDPLLSIYIDLQMGFIAFALVGEACVFLSLQQGCKTKKAPLWLTKLLLIPSYTPTKSSSPKRLSLTNTKLGNNVEAAQQSKLLPYHDENKDTPASSPNIAVTNNDDDNIHATLKHNGSIRERNKERLSAVPIAMQQMGSEAVVSHPADMVLIRSEQRIQWELIASRVETLVIALYTFAIIFTPFYMFYFSRLVNN